jgi:hypothetical protein
MRDLGRYYEVFGETFAVAAIDMKTAAANYEKSGDAATAVSRPADRRKYEGFGEPTPPALLACGPAPKHGKTGQTRGLDL